MGRIFSLSLVLLLASSAWAVDLTPESEAYVGDYLGYLDARNSEGSLTQLVSAANESMDATAEAVANLKVDEQDAKSRLSSLPGLIQSEESAASSKKARVDALMSIQFPTANSVADAESQVMAKKTSLDFKKTDLERGMENVAWPYKNTIETLNQEETDLTSENETKVLENKGYVIINQDILDDDLPPVEEKLKKVRQLKNSGNLQVEIESTELKYAEAIQKIAGEGIKCRRGLALIIYGQRKGPCRNRDRAKNHLAYLKSIKNGSLMRRLQDQIDGFEGQIKENRRQMKSNRRTMEANEARLSQVVIGRNGAEADLRLVTLPCREELARVNFKLEQMVSEIQNIEEIVSIDSQRKQHMRNTVKMNQELTTLPGQIASYPAQITAAQGNAKKATDDVIRLAGQLAATVKTISDIQTRIDSKKEDLQAAIESAAGDITLDTVLDLQDIGAEVGVHTDWHVLTVDEDTVFSRALCKAETIEEKEGDLSFKLQVVKLAGSLGYNEPTVVVTVESSSQSLKDYDKLTMKAVNSAAEFELTMAPSLSGANKRVFLVSLGERQALIDIILAKLDFTAKFSDTAEDNIAVFSLRGSTNAIKRKASSLAKACGGIEIQ